MTGRPRASRQPGFTLLPVVLAMSLVAAIAFLLNRDNGVNAAMLSGQDDAERARLAAEAGLQAANYVVQQIGCAGGYPTSALPVTNNAFGGAAYSAFADRASGSPLALTATGTYNGASVTLTRSTVYAYQSPMRSYTLQPGPETGRDTHLDTKFPDRNYGGDTDLKLDAADYALLIRFDFSALPAGSRVIPWYDGAQLRAGAQLGLYASNVGAATSDVINVHRVSRSWTPGTMKGSGQAPDGATWNSYDGVQAWSAPGGDYAGTELASAPVTSAVGWISWDVTDAVIAWMSGLYANDGMRLFPVGNGVKNVTLVSSDNTNSAMLRPEVDLSYLLPCGATAPS